MFSGNDTKADLYFENLQETVSYHSRFLNGEGGGRVTNDDCLPCQRKQSFRVKKSQPGVHFEHGGRRRQDGGGQTVSKNAQIQI